ncbi:MAG TPA: DUF4292 domain-containing protein [Bacteroidota bacterium]
MNLDNSWFSLIIVLVVLSCSPKPASVLLDTERTSAGSLVQLVNANEQKIHSLVGSGHITFDTPELSGTATFTISMKKPDSLLALFEGPFGIDLGTLFLSRNRYLIYNSFENTAITGTPGSETLKLALPIDLTYDQLLSAFSGTIHLPDDQNDLVSYSIDEDQFLLTYDCGNLVCKYWVDASYLVVTSQQVLDQNGQVVMDVRFSSIREQDAIHAPRRIRLNFPERGRQVALQYGSLTLNEETPSFQFSIPSNAHVITR